jgi:hypothetical protein
MKEKKALKANYALAVSTLTTDAKIAEKTVFSEKSKLDAAEKALAQERSNLAQNVKDKLLNDRHLNNTAARDKSRFATVEAEQHRVYLFLLDK